MIAARGRVALRLPACGREVGAAARAVELTRASSSPKGHIVVWSARDEPHDDVAARRPDWLTPPSASDAPSRRRAAADARLTRRHVGLAKVDGVAANGLENGYPPGCVASDPLRGPARSGTGCQRRINSWRATVRSGTAAQRPGPPHNCSYQRAGNPPPGSPVDPAVPPPYRHHAANLPLGKAKLHASFRASRSATLHAESPVSGPPSETRSSRPRIAFRGGSPRRHPSRQGSRFLLGREARSLAPGTSFRAAAER